MKLSSRKRPFLNSDVNITPAEGSYPIDDYYFFFPMPLHLLLVISRSGLGPVAEFQIGEGISLSTSNGNLLINQFEPPTDENALSAGFEFSLETINTYADVVLRPYTDANSNPQLKLLADGLGVTDIVDTDPITTNFLSFDFGQEYELDDGGTLVQGTIAGLTIQSGTGVNSFVFTSSNGTTFTKTNESPSLLFRVWYTVDPS